MFEKKFDRVKIGSPKRILRQKPLHSFLCVFHPKLYNLSHFKTTCISTVLSYTCDIILAIMRSSSIHCLVAGLNFLSSFEDFINSSMSYLFIILPVEGCSANSRKLVFFKSFSQRSFLNFTKTSFW